MNVLKKKTKCYIYTRVSTAIQIDDMLAKLITAMTKEIMTELKSQIYELKKNQIDADSIYGFLGSFNKVYSECTGAEKKQFM